MNQAIIQLAYRRIIDATSAQSTFEQQVFEDSYQEFLIQIQTYNQDQRFTTWQELRTAIPKSDVTLQYKVGFAVGLYLRALNHQNPYLTDSLGYPVPFEEHRFELLDSDITDRRSHRVALTFLSGPLTLLGTVGTYLLLDRPGQRGSGDTSEKCETFLVEMQPQLAIVSYQEVPASVYP